jgi:hypothetical protein
MQRQKERDNKSLKLPALAIPVLIAILLAASVLYYKERMLFIDAPHVLFRIINDRGFFISDYRYGSFISQLFPLVGIALHLSLKWVMIVYSAGFYVFYLSVSLLLVCKYRDYKLAILFGLYLTLFASATFFWPNNEVHQGIAWLLLAFAVNFAIAAKKWPVFVSLPIFAASFYLAIFTHPVIMIATIYLWLFFYLSRLHWPYSKAQSLICSGVLLLILYLKFNQGLHDGYDSTKIENVTGFHPGQFKKVFFSAQLRFFVKNCLTNYWVFPVLFAAGIVSLVRQRRFAILSLTVFASAAYLFLVCITFPDMSDNNRFYMESEYMPLVLLACAPFVYYTLPQLRPAAATFILALIFISRLAYIAAAAAPFTNRVAILDGIHAKMKEKNLAKIIIHEPIPAVDEALILNWGVPVESFFLSALHGERPQRTFFFSDGNQLKAFNTHSRDTFLGCWEKRCTAHLNSRYFQLDTTTPYTTIDYSSLMR